MAEASDTERLAFAIERAREEGELRLYELGLRELPGIGELTNVRGLAMTSLSNLETAAGVEKLVSLEAVDLYGVSVAVLGDLFSRLAELPGLTRLSLDPDSARALPESFERLQGVLEIEVRGAAKVPLARLFSRLGKLAGHRILRLRGHRRDGVMALPDSLRALTQLRELIVDAPCPMLGAVVTELSALEVLEVTSPNLKRHVIEEIPPDIGRLSALRVLHLRGHKVKKLPDSLADLKQLRSLDLLGSPFERLPARFCELENLEALDLSCCQNLTALPEHIGRLRGLRTLMARDTGIRALPASFAELRLTHVELPGDLAASVVLAPPEVLFVQELSIHRPHDEALPEDLGDPVKLDVQAPNVCRPATAFSQLRRLESLSLGPAPAFPLADALARLASAPRLSRLYLNDWKHLEALPPEIGGLVHLETLQLRGNGLSTLPAEIGALTGLKELDLSGNPLRSFPEACASLVSLEDLGLAGVHPVPEGLRHFRRVKKLYLSRLPDRDLPAELGALTQLESLDLHSCETTDFAVLGELRSLRTLSTSWLGAFDPVALFRALSQNPIEVLSLHYARYLSALPPELGELRSLRSIDVRSTSVRAFPPETAQLSELRLVEFHDFMIRPADLKKVLPKGRWRKEGSGDRTCYRRVD